MQNKIIQFLKSADGYLSGEEVSRQLKISRAGIWKYMQELRREGYDIVAVPHLGYKLVSSPDKLLPMEIQSGLNGGICGRQVKYYETTPSTMDAAFQLGVEGAIEGTVVCAEHQTKGKGRLGRSWVSPKGKGIYFSVILRPSLAPGDVAQLTLLSAVAVCEAIRSCTKLQAKIKWPNDILVHQKKMAGILTELSAEMDRVRFVVIGVGVNVNASLSQIPAGATSVKHETGKKCSRVVIAREILVSIERWYGRLQHEGFAPVIQRWKDLSATLGNRVRVIEPGGNIEGEAVDLDKNGGLMIRRDNGDVVMRMTGDVLQIL